VVALDTGGHGAKGVVPPLAPNVTQGVPLSLAGLTFGEPPNPYIDFAVVHFLKFDYEVHESLLSLKEARATMSACRTAIAGAMPIEPPRVDRLTAQKQILWESETATPQEVNQKEREFIFGTSRNDPSVGYNRRPRFTPTRSS